MRSVGFVLRSLLARPLLGWHLPRTPQEILKSFGSAGGVDGQDVFDPASQFGYTQNVLS